MSKTLGGDKFDKNGLLCVIDDNIPTAEEIEKSLKEVPPEKLAQWNKEHREIARKLGIELN